MTEYLAFEESIEIPKGVGVAGFQRALGEVLRLPRLQEVHIDARGKVTYCYFARERLSAGLDIDFASVMPYAVVRQSLVTEHFPKSSHAATVIGELFAAAARDQVYPVAWVSGPASRCWRWYQKATGIDTHAFTELHGLSFLTDQQVDDDVLLLCAAYGRGASFAETQRTYKLVVPDVGRT